MLRTEAAKPGALAEPEVVVVDRDVDHRAVPHRTRDDHRVVLQVRHGRPTLGLHGLELGHREVLCKDECRLFVEGDGNHATTSRDRGASLIPKHFGDDWRGYENGPALLQHSVDDLAARRRLGIYGCDETGTGRVGQYAAHPGDCDVDCTLEWMPRDLDDVSLAEIRLAEETLRELAFPASVRAAS